MNNAIDRNSVVSAPQDGRKPALAPGVPPLKTIYIYASGSCNLACRHCWISPEITKDGKPTKDISLDLIEKAIIEAKPLGLRSVKLTGGEPVIHHNFKGILQLLRTHSLPMTLETNGTLIGEDLAAFLKDTGLLKHVSVSLDGATPKTHEELRMVRGSFDSAIRGIKALVNQGIKPQIIFTIYKKNVHELEKVIRTAIDLKCGSVKFNLAQSIGRGQNLWDAGQALTVLELVELGKFVEAALVPRYNMLIHFDWPMAFKSIRNLLRGGICHCPIFNIIGLLSSGHYALCGIGTTMPELIYGHSQTDNLETIWNHDPKLKELRDVIPNNLEGICAECIHRDMCLGSCIAHNFIHHHKLTGPYWFCDRAHELNFFPESRRK